MKKTLVQTLLTLSAFMLVASTSYAEKQGQAAEMKPLRFGVIADVQYDATKEPNAGRRYPEALGKLEKAIDAFNAEKLDFVVDLGDKTDGPKEYEDKVLEAYSKLKPKLYHVAGNHDLWQHGATLIEKKFGIDGLSYVFDVKGWRFIVVDSLDVSNYSDDPAKREMAKEMRAVNPNLRAFDGAISKELLAWLDEQLSAAKKEGEKAIILSHVPASEKAAAKNVSIWNSAEVLALLKKYDDSVVLWLSGHHHQGGYARIDGIHHLTVQAICNAPEGSNAYAVLEASPDKIEVRGYGSVPSRTLEFASPSPKKENEGIAGVVVDETGEPVANAIVVSDNGRIVKSGADGSFALRDLGASKYAIKAMAQGMEEKLVPGVEAANGKSALLRITMKKATEPSCLVYGELKDSTNGQGVPAYLEIKDASGPLRWFDVGGASYGGRVDVPKGVWHERNPRQWSLGSFAFMAKPGKTRIAVHADGYAQKSIEIDLQEGKPLELEITMTRLFDPAAEGWFKGDFHAHGVHGEKLYQVNVPFFAFTARAESYRWLYVSRDFNNDGLKSDNDALAKAESSDGFLMLLNAEYPKTKGGHVGSVGIEAPKKPLPYPRYSNAEAIKADILDKGGAAVPVHPLYDHMRSRELPFDIAGAPELFCGFDFYTAWDPAWERTWAYFLNKGHKLCRTATSDAAFDLGRTPGTMGATYIFPEGGVLSKESIVEAFKKGRTSIAWNGALLVFKIDGRVCGEVYPADGTTKKASVELLYAPGEEIALDVLRNGEPFKSFKGAIPKNGRLRFEFETQEKEKAWFTALARAGERVIAASSPFYFGDWRVPEPLVAQIKAKVFDAETKEPVDAIVGVVGSNLATRTERGEATVKARVFQRLKVESAGYQSLEKGVLSATETEAFVNAVSESDLKRTEVYEKAAELLGDLSMDFPLKKK